MSRPAQVPDRPVHPSTEFSNSNPDSSTHLHKATHIRNSRFASGRSTGCLSSTPKNVQPQKCTRLVTPHCGGAAVGGGGLGFTSDCQHLLPKGLACIRKKLSQEDQNQLLSNSTDMRERSSEHRGLNSLGINSSGTLGP